MYETEVHRFLWLVNDARGLAVIEAVTKEAPETIAFVSSDDSLGNPQGVDRIKRYCQENNIEFRFWRDLRPELGHAVTDAGATGIVAIGWRHVLKKDLWEHLPDRLIVFHDSLLPRFRGFAPVASGMIKGEDTFGLTVFFAGGGVDDGDIILQRPIQIDSTTYMAEAQARFTKLYRDAALELLSKLRDGKVVATPQDETQATYSVWRNPEDCRIEWRQDATDVYNLIRAVGDPYPGAYSYLGDQKVYIRRALVLPKDLQFEVRDCGKIWQLSDGYPDVICGSGLLKILDMVDAEGRSLIPVRRLRQRFL